MFIKRLLCLLLCASLFAGLVPAACAEAVYQPGEISGRLISDALRSGDMLCADIELDLALRPQALGVAEEDAALVEMICTHLKNAVLTVGAAQIPGGAALLLRAEYGDPGVSADVTLGVTGDGASLETSLLPGERLCISWEDALMLAGLDDADRAAVLSLRSIDPAQAMQLIVFSPPPRAKRRASSRRRPSAVCSSRSARSLSRTSCCARCWIPRSIPPSAWTPPRCAPPSARLPPS